MLTSMAKLVVFEDGGYVNLLPLVYWRAVFELRCGYGSLLDKIMLLMPDSPPTLFVRDVVADVVAERYDRPVNQAASGDTVFVNGRLLRGLTAGDLEPGTYGMAGGSVVYIYADDATAATLSPQTFLDAAKLDRAVAGLKKIDLTLPKHGLIDYPWNIVLANEEELLADWGRWGGDAVVGTVEAGAYLLNKGSIYIGPGSRIMPCVVLDAENGPIYIGANVTVSSNSIVQGPSYIGNGTLIQPASLVRHHMSIGPVCKIGGEVEESIVHGYSNKQHTGFLGHAYVGEWVNLGAGCTNSDLKNTYGPVRVPVNGVEVDTGERFVGMTVGDHSKTGINASFSTGSVIGTCSNVFVSHTPKKFTPSLSWYTDEGMVPYDIDKAIQVSRTVMGRRKKDITPAMETLYRRLPALTAEHELQAE